MPTPLQPRASARRGPHVTGLACALACALAVAVVGGHTWLRAAGPALTFTDATAKAGISFVHQNGAAGAFWYPELFGGGVAVLDVDSDGWPDLLVAYDWGQVACYRNVEGKRLVDATEALGEAHLALAGKPLHG